MTIYLDCNATTPIDPEVMEVVRHYMEVDFGNAGSRTHEFGLRAKQAVERAREQVAAVVDAKPDEVIFTSGATEANNLAILELEAEGRRTGKMHIISTQIEHKAVLEPLQALGRRGFTVSLLPPGSAGFVPPEAIRGALGADTLLVSAMCINNETGVIQPIDAYVDAIGNHDCYLHVDAAQAFGRAPMCTSKRVDMMSISGHKAYGPKGVGALVARRRGYRACPLSPLAHGGSQERGLRPGTLPVALVAGLGEVSRQYILQGPSRQVFNSRMQCRMVEALVPKWGRLVVPVSVTSPNAIGIILHDIDAEALMVASKGRLALSAGSACTSSSRVTSHVLLAMGLERDASRYIRISWCHLTPAHAVEAMVGVLEEFCL